ncbi:MAG: DUF2709 domain-containing protein [Chlamydiae bacterium]|jgi:hypothetical protein|nr:DUF2709 domain-containing protein [Chlamydiota bacterium]
MTKLAVSDGIISDMEGFLKKNRKADLITTYLFFLEKKHRLDPVVFMREKKIYQSRDDLIRILESQGKLWRETEIKIQMGKPSVNEATKKIYICPFTGKVFGDNTHANPQDAIYEWVMKCPENTERKDGMRVKKFYISEDPEVIRSYIKEQKEPLKKMVYTSVSTGKLFHSREGVVEDFCENQIKSIPMRDVTTQNRFEIQEEFLAFIQTHLEESKIAAFVEALSQYEPFAKHVERWMEEGAEETEAEEEEE